MKIASWTTSIGAVIKKIFFIYLPCAGCILFSNYQLPEKIVPIASSHTTPVYDPLYHSFPKGTAIQNTVRVTPLVEKPKVSINAKVAIIIDDVGYSYALIKEIAGLSIPLTWSFLPFTPYVKECLAEARTHGFEVMLHLPLEPLEGTHDPGPGVISHNWSEREIEQQLNRDLEAVPGAIGLNNHMGSLGTQDPYLIACLMRIIKKKQMFFIDSRTSSRSVVEEYAVEYHVPFAKRKVFIDNEADINSKKAALQELIEIALKDGSAIGIAHVKEGNADIINRMLPEFKKAGIMFVPVSELAK